ncbi:MAG: hypothetical protein IJH75_05315 [Mogibacterium sp.]|nr:hypothetical protein [Mogibacterium sp.]
MKILSNDQKDYVLNVTIQISKEEFDKARMTAYLDHTDRYPVPGVAAGNADLGMLESTYGPAVLYDEALEKAVPELFNRFLKEEQIRIVGRPQMDDMRFAGGGVLFHVKADLYPEIELGQYKGILVPYLRMGEQDRFEQAVLQKACENMKGEIPPHMVEQKMNAIIAREKLNVSNEAIYHLLADAEVILKQAYEAAGAVRPKVQYRREAMDLMLQTVSEAHQNDWQEFFREQIKVMAERYHDLPEDYDHQLEEIIKKRQKDKNRMEKEALIEEIFKAYLGSLELTEEQWRNQRSMQAAREVCVDLLLDAVSAKEGITVSSSELHDAVEEIAAQVNMTPEEVENKMDLEPLRWKLARDKAMMLILNSASTDEALRAKLIKEAERKAAEQKEQQA